MGIAAAASKIQRNKLNTYIINNTFAWNTQPVAITCRLWTLTWTLQHSTVLEYGHENDPQNEEEVHFFFFFLTFLSILQQALHVWIPAQHQKTNVQYIYFFFSFFPSPWVVSHVLSSCQATLVGRKELDGVFCQGLMVSLPPQMVIEWDSHKSGPGSSAASVWGQPHYKQSGPPPGCRDVPVYGVQHGWSYSQ